MKKLNLQLGSIKDMLTKEQMKKISGGYDGDGGGGDCTITCWDGGHEVWNGPIDGGCWEDGSPVGTILLAQCERIFGSIDSITCDC